MISQFSLIIFLISNWKLNDAKMELSIFKTVRRSFFRLVSTLVIDNMQFIHEFTWSLVQIKAQIIPLLCMLSYFESISIISYIF